MTGSSIKVTFLGTGTSVGVPVLTCECPVCTSEDPRNQRLRAGLLLEWDAAVDGGTSNVGKGQGDATRTVKVLVDTSTDFRQQALRAGLERVDAVLYTHPHADHIFGLDDVRLYNYRQRSAIPLYGNSETMAAIQHTFKYAFVPGAKGVPRLSLHGVSEPFDLFGRTIIPIPVWHDSMRITAYRIGNFAYVTDCSEIPAEAAGQLEGLEFLVIDSLRREPHPSHFTLDQALEQIGRLQPARALLTHLSHDFDHASLEEELSDDIGVAYDGLVIEMPMPGDDA
jgi:phosphoribosyl 1,2-cyclic phosphate phosphodiesterase